MSFFSSDRPTPPMPITDSSVALPSRGAKAASGEFLIDPKELVERILASYARRFGLSPQEHRLLRCAVNGVPDKRAADELGCSRNTLSTYWKRIFEKTGARPQKQVMAHILRVTVGGDRPIEDSEVA